MMWGVVVEKLMMMWGQGEDDTKGRVSLTTTHIPFKTDMPKYPRTKQIPQDLHGAPNSEASLAYGEASKVKDVGWSIF